MSAAGAVKMQELETEIEELKEKIVEIGAAIESNRLLIEAIATLIDELQAEEAEAEGESVVELLGGDNG